MSAPIRFSNNSRDCNSTTSNHTFIWRQEYPADPSLCHNKTLPWRPPGLQTSSCWKHKRQSSTLFMQTACLPQIYIREAQTRHLIRPKMRCPEAKLHNQKSLTSYSTSQLHSLRHQAAFPMMCTWYLFHSLTKLMVAKNRPQMSFWP